MAVVVGRMQARLQEAAASATTPQEGLHAMVSVYLQMAESSPHVRVGHRDGPFDPIRVPRGLRGEPALAAAAPDTGPVRGASRVLRQRDGNDRSPRCAAT